MQKMNGRINKESAVKKDNTTLKSKSFKCENCGKECKKSNVVFGKTYYCSECGGFLSELTDK